MCRNYLLSLLLYSFVGVSIQKDLWYPYQFGSGHGNRRELFISKLDAVDTFKTQENVLEWRSLSLRNRSIALGLTENGVTILQVAKNGESLTTNETHVSMNASVFDAAIFKYWKRDTAKSEIIVVVAVDAQHANSSVDLLWFRLNYNNQLIKIWKWSLRKKIIHLNVFKLVDDDNYNIWISNERYENYTTTDWYQFHLGQQNDFWLKQAIHLDFPTNSTAISSHGSKTYLSIPQKDKLRIFSLEEQNTRFINCYNFSVGYVSFVISFKVAFQSYIAIDGHSAGIYKFTAKPSKKNGYLVKENIENANLHGINYWLAIPISTYRDEEVLIAEKLIDFNTHKTTSIQVIIHHGGRFVLHEESICDYYGEISNGFNCLAEEDKNMKGIKGATFITVNDTLGVLVPRQQKESGLFTITTEMRELKSPLQEKMNAFEEKKKEIEEKIKLLKDTLHSTTSKQTDSEKDDFPQKKLVTDKVKEEVISQPQAATRDNILAQSSPIIDLNMDEITRRVSALQENINNMMEDVPKIKTFDPNQTKYDTLVLKGLVEVQGPSNIKTVSTQFYNGATTEKIVTDIYHVQTGQRLQGHKHFINLRTDAVEFNIINGIPFESLKFQSDPLVFEDDIFLDGELIVEGNVESDNVDNFNLGEEIIYLPSNNFTDSLQFEFLNIRQVLDTDRVNKFPVHHNYQDAIVADNPSLDNIKLESLFIPGNLSVITINGENFNETLRSLCMKNQNTFVPNSTLIEGNVVIKSEAFTLQLNGLRFPQDYVLSNSNTFAHITAEKLFTNDTIIGELTTEGKVNGILPQDVVTLSKPQEISGKLSFASLDVTNELQLNGRIVGSFPENQITSKSSLFDTNQISSDCNFKILEVTGKVTVDDQFNNTNLKERLADVVYKSEQTTIINSVKQFPYGLTVIKDLQLASKAINKIEINKLVHKDTSEVLNFKQLDGDVTFENLVLIGTFNGVDVVKLDQEAVKLTGEQFISSEIIFEDELTVSELNVKQVLNDVPLEQYLYSNGKVFMDTLNIDELTVENLIVQKDIISHEDNINLKDFDARRFSLSREQSISVPFFFSGSRIPNLHINFINDHHFSNLFNLDIYANKIMDLIMSGQVAIKELTVDDTLSINTLNGKPMEDIMKQCLSTKEGERELEVNFENVRFRELIIEKFNDIHFDAFRRNLVFKDETDVEIQGLKVYFNGFEIKNFIQTSAINDISINDILRKNERQEIASPLLIVGHVKLEGDCQLQGTFNRVPIDNITNAFRVVEDHTYEIQGDVLFSQGPIIENLRVKYINGIDMKEFFNDVIYFKGDTVPKLKNITFTNTVGISGNLNAKKIDDLDLRTFKDEVVIVTQDGVMSLPVIFENDIFVQESVQVETDLFADNIRGVQPERWMSKAVFINKGRIAQHLNFASTTIESDVTTESLNNINVTSLILLKSDVNLNAKLTFDEISSIKDIKVKNLVNSKNLPYEYRNTVMSNKIQQINDIVIFNGNIVVRENLEIYGLVNNKHLDKIVTTDDDQLLEATYRFMEKTMIDNDITITNLVNSINITKWYQNGIKKSYHEPQLISNSWEAASNITFEKDVTGYGYINGIDIHKMALDVESRRAFKYTVEKDLVNNYERICADINSLIASAKKQIFSFKYLDYKQIIELPGMIEYVHQFDHENNSYLLVNDRGCTSKLFIWMEDYFTMVQELETGTIAQVVSVRDNKNVYLITRDLKSDQVKSKGGKSLKVSETQECTIDGSNVWKFDDEKLVLLQKINVQTLLHESKIPGTFYAIENEDVLEYRIFSSDENFYGVQKWTVPTENAAFLEAGLKTGLSIRNGHHLFKLNRQEVPLDINNNQVVISNFTTIQNMYIPGRNMEVIMMNVGYPRWKTMMAVATREETSVIGKLDFIKIYEDPMSGKVFHKVPTFRPSSILSLEFGNNGETLLIFLENKELLQIYEYKGVEGFKFKAKANVDAEKLIKINLPCGSERKRRSFIGLVKKNHLALLEVVMDGDQLHVDELTCKLS